MSIGTDPLTELRLQLEAVATDPDLDPTSRAQKLRLFRDQLKGALGLAETYLGDVNLEREAETAEVREAIREARLRATLRATAIDRGLAAPEELDAEGWWSHEDLDELEEEGLLQEAAINFERLHPRRRTGAPGGGEFIKKLFGEDVHTLARKLRLEPPDTVSVPGQPPVSEKALQAIHKYHLDTDLPPTESRGERAKKMFDGKPYEDTRQMHQVRDGVYSAERHKVHQQIVDELLAGHESQEHPAALIMAGGPASGKSVALRAHPDMRPDDAVDVNPDEVMERLPEYKQLKGDPYMAYAFHEEASDVARLLLEQARERKMNLVLDGVGDSGKGKFVNRIREIKKAGYATNLVMVDTDTNTAISRSIERALVKGSPDEGRFIAISVVKELHRNAIARMDEWMTDESVDHFLVYRTGGAWGDNEAQRVADGGHGKIHIIDDELLKKMKAKRNEETGRARR